MLARLRFHLTLRATPPQHFRFPCHSGRSSWPNTSAAHQKRFYRQRHPVNYIRATEATPGWHSIIALAVFAGITLPIAGLWWASTEEVPITKRRRALLVDEEMEKALGEAALEGLPLHAALLDNEPRVKAVRAVGERIADAVEELLDELDAAKAKEKEKLADSREGEAKAMQTAARDGAVGASKGPQAAHETTAAAETEPMPPRRRGGGITGRLGKAIDKLLGVQPRRRWAWRFIVLDQPVVNALCAPGGIVVVFTGLLDAIDDAVKRGDLPDRESALATCMAHEIAHAVARHGAERASTMPAQVWVGWLSGSSPLLPVLVDFLYARPYSRALEEEADAIGMHLMARACYDAAKAPPFYGMLGKASQLSQAAGAGAGAGADVSAGGVGAPKSSRDSGRGRGTDTGKGRIGSNDAADVVAAHGEHASHHGAAVGSAAGKASSCSSYGSMIGPTISHYLSTHPADHRREEATAALAAVLGLQQKHFCVDGPHPADGWVEKCLKHRP